MKGQGTVGHKRSSNHKGIDRKGGNVKMTAGRKPGSALKTSSKKGGNSRTHREGDTYRT